jgi:hypothetical protein
LRRLRKATFGRAGRYAGLWAALLGLTLGSSGCLHFGWNRLSTKVAEPVLDTIKAEDMATDVKALEGDAHQPRAPFTREEERTMRYLTRRFRSLGLQPAGDGGDYLHSVPVVFARVEHAELGVGKVKLEQGQDLLLWARGDAAQLEEKDKKLVFVGHGVFAPERGRDDYADLDLRGSVALVLAGLHPDRWYSQWQYQVAEAARHGAEGVLLVRGGADSSRTWAQWRDSFELPRYFRRGDTQEHCAFEAWISNAAGDRILKQAGIDPARARTAARSPGFRGRELESKVSLDVQIERRFTRSFDLVGEIPGRFNAEQSLLICAPWDGGEANARAMAGLLALAKAFSSLAERPARSIVFVASTLSNEGNLGAEGYAAHPHRELGRCAAALLPMGGGAAPTAARDDTLFCAGTRDNELGSILRESAAQDDMALSESTGPNEWLLSCGPAFARQGVPSAVIGASVPDLRMALRAGYRMAQTRGGPRWDAQSPFRFYPRPPLVSAAPPTPPGN